MQRGIRKLFVVGLAALVAIVAWPVQLFARPAPLQLAVGSRRADVRDEMTARYHALDRPAPHAQVFAPSPFTGALAAAFASTVWWLRSHPEAHQPLFGRLIGERELAIALDRAVRIAVTRGMTALAWDDPPSPMLLARATDAALTATRNACNPADEPTIAEPYVPDSQRDAAVVVALDTEALALRPRDHVELTLRTRDHDTQLAAINVALGTVLQSSSDRANDVSAMLLRVLPYWWQTRGALEQRDLGPRGPHFLHANFWIASDAPSWKRTDEHGRLHGEAESALAWRDGWSLSYLLGIPVAPRVAHGQFTVGDIHATRNVELRRLLVEMYERGDHGRYARDAGAEVIDTDVDVHGHPRELLRVAQPGDEPYVAVRVTNTTAEPDGYHKRYTLRVPPHITTCRDAVAWTFGLPTSDYAPEFES